MCLLGLLKLQNSIWGALSSKRKRVLQGGGRQRRGQGDVRMTTRVPLACASPEAEAAHVLCPVSLLSVF